MKTIKLPAAVMESLLCRTVRGISEADIRRGVAVLSGPLQDDLEYDLVGDKVHIFCMTERVAEALFVDNGGVAIKLLTALLRHGTEVHAPNCPCDAVPPSKRGGRVRGAKA